MSGPLQRLLDPAEGQWGLITRRQAQRAGVGPTSLARLLENDLIERVAHGVYRVRGAGEPDHLALRAAWLQLDPDRLAWERVEDPTSAVVSHVSATSLYGVGDLRADVHDFTLPVRRQGRRHDVRLHRATVPAEQRTVRTGLPVVRAGRMIADLIADHLEPDPIAQITSEVLAQRLADEAVIAELIAPYATRFGLARDDGTGLLDHLLARGDLAAQAPVTAAAHHT